MTKKQPILNAAENNNSKGIKPKFGWKGTEKKLQEQDEEN